MSVFPIRRMRRLRRTETLRRMRRETVLRPEQLIWPLFVEEGRTEAVEIASMPGQYRHPVATLCHTVEAQMKRGLSAVLLFGIPAEKDAEGSEADAENGIVQEAVRALKQGFGDDLMVITDVCMCEYTDHGHCGILDGHDVDNDATLARLASTALSHAEAGADMVAPSDMMDGRIATMRELLDEEGYPNLPIMSYAVKYASAFYGPFRDAADSTPAFGDRRSYQMDPANSREAILEALGDEEEGADILMVKPAGPYLDILSEIRQETDLPLAAYQVSGEYAMLHAAARNGWLEYDRVLHESVLGIVRAGADLVITYGAPDLLTEMAR